MFGIGFGEMLIIALVLLLAVGPKDLPKLLKTVGKGVREVKKASTDLRRSVGIDELMRDEELRNPLKVNEPARRKLTPADLERESPREGADVAQARQRLEEAQRVAQLSARAREAASEEGA